MPKAELYSPFISHTIDIYNESIDVHIAVMMIKTPLTVKFLLTMLFV